MPITFKNPLLEDYFVEVPGVAVGTPADQVPSIVEPFEQGKVLVFPDLKPSIDHEFWANLPTDEFPGLKKLKSQPTPDYESDPVLARGLAVLPHDLASRLREEIMRLYRQVMPTYAALFDGYAFTNRSFVWRLQTTLNENLHVDTYKNQVDTHFARMFINLDNQPRIWKTSYTTDQLLSQFGQTISLESLEAMTPAKWRSAVNFGTFGENSQAWWDNQPRHVVYFQPGDVWVVDSRQVAHQIFYGRRALSIDFTVDAESMRDPNRQYLRQAELAREARLAQLRSAAATS